MTPTKAAAVAPVIPSDALPDANWADAFEISTQRRFNDMRELALATVGTTPSWAKWLLKMRNFIVAPIGLKPDGKGDAPSPESRIAIFPILHESENRIVLGMDDVHLNFRVVIERHVNVNGYRIRATTLVQRHNAFGKIYIRLVAPIHKLCVAAALQQAI